ncbi:MAG: hypothetical protein E6G55_01240 [Actinobacteria bacterium]|nr:MAG: hypothetical protein E6K97_03685 [Nitrososphaerota archaeon]TMK48929.1 MAG: hypothetical protein E6G55_01240 [Actinomycetota bacterium]
MTLSLLQKLEALGFQNFFTYRIGPCFQCEETIQTFYNIELRRWYCEKCWYDTDFITELQLSEFGKTMAQVSYEQILARLNAVEAENRKLKASREDNVFVGTTDNLTLKHRALNPRAWGVPTKNQEGKAFFRCSDFPFTFDIAPDRKSVRVYTAIPASPDEISLFEQRFINQQIVVAKRRQSKEDAEASGATTQAFSAPPSATPMPVATTPVSSTRSFSQLNDAEKKMYIDKAQSLMSIPGLFKSLQEALQSVLQPANISLP